MFDLPRGNIVSRRICQNVLVFQWFPKDSQDVAMVRMSEEDPYVFLANSGNVGFPNDFLRFSANPSRYLFLTCGNHGFLLVLQGFQCLSFMT